MHCGGKKWGKIGEEVIGFSPQTQSYSLGPESLCKISSKSNQSYGHRSVYRWNDRMAEVILQSVPCYAIAMGQIIKV